jgi:hypothetical protein
MEADYKDFMSVDIDEGGIDISINVSYLSSIIIIGNVSKIKPFEFYKSLFLQGLLEQ